MMEDVFTALGAIILIGFLGRAAYKQTKIPESVFMMLIGLLIGPGLGLVHTDALMPIVPFVSVLALILVLLDAGLEFNVFRVLAGFGSAFAFTILVCVTVTSLVGAILHLVFGWELLHALFIGLISSGTTTVAAMTLLELTRASDKVKSFLFLETVINDFTLILGASVILAFIGHGAVSGEGASAFLSGALIASAVGLGCGFLWIHALTWIGLSKYNYIASVGALILTYGAVEAIGGDGIIATLIFAFLLGNYANIAKRFNLEEDIPAFSEGKRIVRDIRFIHGDISFVVRIFFFVLIGAIFRFENLTQDVLLITGGILLLIVIGRYLSLIITCMADKELMKESSIIVAMIPRGFVATVLAFIPAGMGIVIPSLTEIVLLLVLSTNLLAAAASSYLARAGGGEEEAAQANSAPAKQAHRKTKPARKLHKRAGTTDKRS